MIPMNFQNFKVTTTNFKQAQIESINFAQDKIYVNQ